jgi:predicted Mrr-cat superfamily restriction endonuclease
MYWYIKITNAKNKHFERILEDILINKSIGIDFSINQDYNSFNNINDWNTYLETKCFTHNQYLSLKRVFNTFIKEIKINDFVFLCSGSNKIHYICQIDGDYEFDNSYINKYNNTSLCHRRKIKNIVKFDAIAPKQMRCTIYKV